MRHEPLSRRAFVQALPAVAAGASVLCTACAGARYLVPLEVGGWLVIPLSALDGTSGAFVAHPGSNRPVYVARLAGGELVALHAQCTHQGCQPEPVGERLVCPCHGSEFALGGAVLEGPAERPLTRFPVSVSGDQIRIGIEAAR
jgi:thiosulfate dehydrogenase [quinone] large subunit